MAVYFGRPEDWIPGMAGIPLAKLAAIPILLALFVSIGKIRWRFPLEITFFTLLLLQLWISAVFSPVWRGGAANAMLEFSKALPLVLVMYWTVRSMKRLRWILFVQATAAATTATASVVQSRISGGRLVGIISGIYGNSNDLALLIDISLPVCLALVLTTGSSWKRLAWIIGMLVMIYAVFLTASRSGFIALLVVTAVCLWELGIRSRHSYLLLLVPVALTVIWIYGGDALRSRFEESDSRTETYESAKLSSEQRQELLIKSLEVTSQHPLFGVGPGNFSVVSGSWHVAHNANTEISAEGGIPAFLLYALIFWRAIVNLRDIRKQRNRDKEFHLFSMALEASVVAYLVGSFFASIQYQLFPYCLVAYTTALRLIVLKVD